MPRTDRRRRTPMAWATALVGAGCLLAGTLLVPTPASADHGRAPQRSVKPSISEVQRHLTVLNRQGEVASEAYNTVKVRMNQARSRMTVLQAHLASQQAHVAQLRRDLVAAALSDYESTGGLSTSVSFLVAKSPSQFLDTLATSAIVEHQQAVLLRELQQQRLELSSQEQQAEQQLGVISADEHRLATHKAALDKDIRAARQLLGRLKEAQRRRVLALQRHQTANPSNYTSPSRGSERPPLGGAPASGRAAVAVATALAQVGKPYVYGAAGPSAFDCSGLTMYSWAAAGVSLSHSSSIQSQQGVPVSISELRPGDLVFYYSPVSHVAMYIGNGMVVHAPHPGSVVQVVPLTSMPISWARRVG